MHDEIMESLMCRDVVVLGSVDIPDNWDTALK
jgi:hypothetical protein